MGQALAFERVGQGLGDVFLAHQLVKKLGTELSGKDEIGHGGASEKNGKDFINFRRSGQSKARGASAGGRVRIPLQKRGEGDTLNRGPFDEKKRVHAD